MKPCFVLVFYSEIHKYHKQEHLDLLRFWTLVSVQGNKTYTFPDGYILGAGKTVYVTSGPNAKEQLPTYIKWTTANIWANSGDPAHLYDNAGEIASGMD
ncbi:lamin tail domain-containing protein [Domibacillus mangrovi]|uniref:LTD domain-containing protein n=1 Tax=Domibacillus mangrovi TaxID=1714354 RepID=A0A1Q5P4E5_9BACI|nr:lamin tail domain-containing protein [Domibacillus mangrovi]OKL37053.1 hypothetical protein BLL40_05555 [Domibacillus mangrovi]